ncbi:hypothetical protein E2C01_072563 [Portunus trituberculatus]|uniref:Uncharacterized protein n=1 Tax=Portunus trituberculatus TaxID=210409 RepID=A0A5B7IB25_PORTR|nr:hypothetical protein [Portunus trituberculatus]
MQQCGGWLRRKRRRKRRKKRRRNDEEEEERGRPGWEGTGFASCMSIDSEAGEKRATMDGGGGGEQEWRRRDGWTGGVGP